MPVVDEPTTDITLPDSVLILLDGQGSPKVQGLVDAAKKRAAMAAKLPEVPVGIAGFVADVVSRAVTDGRLIFQHRRLRSCTVCNRSAGYAKYVRSSRYHRKGEANYDKPLTFSGIELADVFIRFKGHSTLGCCSDCWSIAEPLAREALSNIRSELPERLAGSVRYLRRWRMKCSRCQWEGHEGQMVMLPALMGGKYPGGCPSCDAANRPFGRTEVERTEGFEIVEDPAPPPEPPGQEEG